MLSALKQKNPVEGLETPTLSPVMMPGGTRTYAAGSLGADDDAVAHGPEVDQRPHRVGGAGSTGRDGDEGGALGSEWGSDWDWVGAQNETEGWTWW